MPGRNGRTSGQRMRGGRAGPQPSTSAAEAKTPLSRQLPPLLRFVLQGRVEWGRFDDAAIAKAKGDKLCIFFPVSNLRNEENKVFKKGLKIVTACSKRRQDI